ncbi:PREDICTED: heat shock 70 kDa protein 12A-like [Branchiostoma belcheri]|uniref:Heat shock 70 kDa protein 12A-like n=1 Tax=Branchiostoma belcheri TaxID=7741 RepID=A0A6P4YJR0_BRABE|nr:PREDICTED: heat shock 70 kDa protein 12A-like [Branchiostoma belcheri]
MERRKCLLVAAIDFGTTFSGYAFSFTSSKDNIIMNKNWGSESGFLAHKTETSVLLNPKGEFKAFGSEASSMYADLEQSDATRHFYFHRFKMELYTEKKLTKDTTIKDANGKRLPAIDIFAHAMRYLKDHMLRAIKLTVSSENELEDDDICWVLTVPAIWDDSAKQFMRQAAYKAGIASEDNDGQLLIALEPEAAGIFCCHDATDNQLVEVEKGDRYMIVDCGGGTVDIAVHEVSENNKAKEVSTASGGNWGGTKVDEQFLKLLDAIFGADLMARYKVAHPNEHLNLLNEFETKKRSTSPHTSDDAGVVAVHLGYNFFQFYPKHTGGRTVQQAIKQYGSPQVAFSNGLIRMSHSLMKSFFKPAIDSILSHLDTLVKKKGIMPLKYIFMAGGFSESPILQHAVKEKFESVCSVLVPDGCGLSIIKGAVMFGHNPTSIAARRSKYTYGTSVCRPFVRGYHPLRLAERIDGELKCTRVFSKFVEAGQLVEVGEVSEHIFSPARRLQRTMGIEIFVTNEKEVEYCDEEGVTKCGYVVVGLPPPLSGITRDVKATITFSETEIKVDAFALGSGERASTKVDFLQD